MDTDRIDSINMDTKRVKGLLGLMQGALLTAEGMDIIDTDALYTMLEDGIEAIGRIDSEAAALFDELRGFHKGSDPAAAQ